MTEPFNVFGDEWESVIERPGGTFHDTPVLPRFDGQLLGGSLYELPPHAKGWPYHFQHANEELLIVLAGTPTLRDPDGERTLAPGDCVLFPRGPEGAHTVHNQADEPARFIMFSTLISPEMVSYPDSGKLAARSDFGRGVFREDSIVDYWEGEE
ncbi:MAG: cupin domain-containing protein [Gaiellaceae bacterium]